MRFGFIVTCVMLLTALHTPVLSANETQEYRIEADGYYQMQDFKKAYKIYYKLAKAGDHFSQDRVSKMYINGEGRKVDLDDAYAWSVLAAEGENAEWTESRDDLLLLTQNQSKAQGKADKLMKKYSEQALREKSEKQALRDSRSCTGSRLCERN